VVLGTDPVIDIYGVVIEGYGMSAHV